MKEPLVKRYTDVRQNWTGEHLIAVLFSHDFRVHSRNKGKRFVLLNNRSQVKKETDRFEVAIGWLQRARGFPTVIDRVEGRTLSWEDDMSALAAAEYISDRDDVPLTIRDCVSTPQAEEERGV